MYSCFKIKCICSRGGRLMSWVYLFLGGSQGWVETSITNSCPCSRAPGPHPQSRDSPAPVTHCRIEHTPSSQTQVGPEGPAQDEGLSCRCLKSSKRWDGGGSYYSFPSLLQPEKSPLPSPSPSLTPTPSPRGAFGNDGDTVGWLSHWVPSAHQSHYVEHFSDSSQRGLYPPWEISIVILTL